MTSRRRFVALSDYVINLDNIAYVNLEYAEGCAEVIFTGGMSSELTYLFVTLNEADTAKLIDALTQEMGEGR